MNDLRKAVFLSYASQDKEAAKRLCHALRAAGVEVWFDVDELRGGDAWDQKIRKQIKECALFVPLISATSDARPEGYFRLEWKLAVDRSHLLAEDHPFLFPIAIGDIDDATARVPDKFREVQWTRLRLDETPDEVAARMANLLGSSRKPEKRNLRNEDDSKIERRQVRPVWVRHAWAAVGIVFALVYGLQPLWRSHRSEEERPEENRTGQTATTISTPDPKSVAVLAFADLSEDESPEESSEGISEALRSALAKIPGLKIPAQTASLRFKGNKTSPVKIAQQLGVAHLIEGSMRKAGDKIRLNVQLIDGADGLQVWSGTFTREAKDILGAEDEMAEAVVGQLQKLFSRAEGDPHPSSAIPPGPEKRAK